MSSKRRVKRGAGPRKGQREYAMEAWCDDLDARRIARLARAGKLHATVIG